jgi:hypothetical protein
VGVTMHTAQHCFVSLSLRDFYFRYASLLVMTVTDVKDS